MYRSFGFENHLSAALTSVGAGSNSRLTAQPLNWPPLAAKVAPFLAATDNYDLWLDPEVSDRAKLESLLVPYEGDEFVATPVSTYVNNVRNQGPECVTSSQAN